MISAIVAYGNEGEIGKNNQLLWGQGEMKADMRHFRELTKDQVVVMGRKTLESIGRALPMRRNIVLTRQTELQVPNGVEIASSLDQAYTMAGDKNVFVIGGSQVYEQSLPSLMRIYATEVDVTDPNADSFFNGLDNSQFKETSRESHLKDENNLYNYEFVTYDRK